MDQSEMRSRARIGSRPAAMTASSSSTSAELRCGDSCMTRKTAAGDPARTPESASTSELNCSRAHCWTLLRCAAAIPARLLARCTLPVLLRRINPRPFNAAATPPTHRACGASRRPAAGKARDRRAPARRSGSHAFAKRRDLLPKPRARLRRQAPGPHFERSASRREEPLPFLVKSMAKSRAQQPPSSASRTSKIRSMPMEYMQPLAGS